MKRNIIKTLLMNLFIITIMGGLFCNGFFIGSSLSNDVGYVAYASADNWTNCDTSDLVTAFRYYCKSRNLVLEGSVADGLTSFTTSTFNSLCNTVGIDITTLQAELKKTTEGNLGLRYLFTTNGINAYNRIFAEFLQNNNLSVGDSVDNEVIYSGNLIDGSFIYVISDTGRSNKNPVIKYGSDLYDGSQLYNDAPQDFTILGKSYSTMISNYDGAGYTGEVVTFGNQVVYRTDVDNFGGVCFAQITSLENKIYLCAYNFWDSNKSFSGYPVGTRLYQFYRFSLEVPIDNIEPANITINTPNDTVINNNTYNNNYTIIYNDGDHYGTDEEPQPDTKPDSDDNDNWNPTLPNLPTPVNPNFPSVEIPNIDIPDLPNLDFSLGDLRDKFPFSLPFDIIAILNVLDGEPQAPVIDATIPIGRWYTWEFHADFSEFDNYARIFRAFEFIGFVIGLAVFTVHLAKG